jgi:hypothetical protein
MNSMRLVHLGYRRYLVYYSRYPRVEVVSIVTSGTCLDGPGGAVLYSQVTELGLLFGELCGHAGGKSLLPPVQGLRWMMMEWLVVLRLVIVVVIVVAVIVVVV